MWEGQTALQSGNGTKQRPKAKWRHNKYLAMLRAGGGLRGATQQQPEYIWRSGRFDLVKRSCRIMWCTNKYHLIPHCQAEGCAVWTPQQSNDVMSNDDVQHVKLLYSCVASLLEPMMLKMRRIRRNEFHLAEHTTWTNPDTRHRSTAVGQPICFHLIGPPEADATFKASASMTVPSTEPQNVTNSW